MKIAVIINSIARPHERPVIIAVLREALIMHELDIRLTEHPGHATTLARRAVEDRADIVVVVGGDGTIGEAVNGMIGSGVRLAVIPTGSANDLADQLGIPKSVAEACALIGSGGISRIDAVWINGRYALTTAGFGIGCETIAWAGRIRRLRLFGTRPVCPVGCGLYLLGYALALASKKGWPLPMTIRQNGLDIACCALSLTISNLPRLGHSFHMAPGARPDDGLLDICAIQNRGRLGAAQTAFRALRGLNSETPRVRQWRAAQAVIESGRPIAYFADGELMPPSTRFEVRVVPEAIGVIVPHEREGK